MQVPRNILPRSSCKERAIPGPWIGGHLAHYFSNFLYVLATRCCFLHLTLGSSRPACHLSMTRTQTPCIKRSSRICSSSLPAWHLPHGASSLSCYSVIRAAGWAQVAQRRSRGTCSLPVLTGLSESTKPSYAVVAALTPVCRLMAKKIQPPFKPSVVCPCPRIFRKKFV
jgi:hypothetical protein